MTFFLEMLGLVAVASFICSFGCQFVECKAKWLHTAIVPTAAAVLLVLAVQAIALAFRQSLPKHQVIAGIGSVMIGTTDFVLFWFIGLELASFILKRLDKGKGGEV